MRIGHDTRLRRAKTLMDDLGVNLAGVEVIMRMAQRMTELQDELEELESKLDKLQGGG